MDSEKRSDRKSASATANAVALTGSRQPKAVENKPVGPAEGPGDQAGATRDNPDPSSGRPGGDVNVREIIATSAVVSALREASTLPGPLAIELLGDRPGTVYLSGGRITCIEMSGIPDLRTRLERSGSVRGSSGLAAIRAPGSLQEAIRQLLSSGDVDGADVESTAESVIIDGAQCLLELSGPATPELRMHPGAVPANGGVHHFGLETVIRAACERITRCAELGIDPDLGLDLRPVTRPVMTMDERQWAIVTKIDGRLTTRDVAWVTGAELFATMKQVAGLVSDGLVRVLHRRPSASAPIKPAVAPAARQLSPAPRQAQRAHETSPIVQQRRSAPQPDGLISLSITPPEEWAADLTAEVTVDTALIIRLITGLREME